jgi:hypothetical protein
VKYTDHEKKHVEGQEAVSMSLKASSSFEPTCKSSTGDLDGARPSLPSVSGRNGESTKLADENGREYRPATLVDSRYCSSSSLSTDPFDRHRRVFTEAYKLGVGLLVIKPDLVANGKKDEIFDYVSKGDLIVHVSG